MLTPEEQQKIFAALLSCPQNHYCAECGGKCPCWASMAFGVFVCLNCSGAHRALGPSVTRVKSVRLDTWNREWLEHVQAGNTNMNKYWQAEFTEAQQHKKPNEHSSVDFIIRFVRDKYIRKLWVDELGNVEQLKAKKLNLNFSKANNKPCKQLVTQSTKIPPPKQQNQPVKKQEMPPPPHQIKKKETSGSKKLHKMQTMGGASPTLQQIKKCSADFSFFDEIVTIKQAKTQNNHNLLSLDEQQPKSMKKNNALIDFDLVPEQPKPQLQKEEPDKYNKQLFMSMGGINPNRAKPSVNFDSFCDQLQKTLQDKKNDSVVQNSYYDGSMNINILGANQKTQAQQNSQSGNQYNKMAFASMGGVSPSQQNQRKANLAFQDIFNKKQAYPSSYQKNPPLHPMHNITLESTINFDKLHKKEAGKGDPPKKSWIDQWK